MPPDVRIAPASQPHKSAVLETPKLPPVLLPLDCFGVQRWQLPYAQALMEEVVPFLPIAVNLAERAILTRYFELHGNTNALEEERQDLWHAVEELQKLRKKCAKT